MKPQAGSAGSRPEAEGSEIDRLRATIRWLQEHRSGEVACSIQWEMHNDPKLKVRQIGKRVGLGEATIRSWMQQQASPTLESIRKVAEGLHPQGRYADPLEWLEAGRQYLNYLIARLEQLELWERRQAVRAKLGPTASVDEVLEVIQEELPEELREELGRRLRAGGKKEEPRDDAGGGF
ncbi:MAG: hypothetical protein GY856_41160 [bacterium]|nr:hypothetical protein [bacterium]